MFLNVAGFVFTIEFLRGKMSKCKVIQSAPNDISFIKKIFPIKSSAWSKTKKPKIEQSEINVTYGVCTFSFNNMESNRIENYDEISNIRLPILTNFF